MDDRAAAVITFVVTVAVLFTNYLIRWSPFSRKSLEAERRMARDAHIKEMEIELGLVPDPVAEAKRAKRREAELERIPLNERIMRVYEKATKEECNGCEDQAQAQGRHDTRRHRRVHDGPVDGEA